MLGDVGATRGILQNGKLAEWYAAKWKQIAEAQRPRTYVFAVGDDANLPLLHNAGAQLTECWNRCAVHRADRFQAECVLIARSDRSRSTDLELTITPAANFDLVYPLEESVFPGACRRGWESIRSRGQVRRRSPREGRRSATTRRCPRRVADIRHLPRAWAKARVDALLEKIEREGEDQRVDRRDHPAVAQIQIRDAVHVVSGRAASAAAASIDSSWRSGAAREDGSIHYVGGRDVPVWTGARRFDILNGEDTWQTRFLAPADMTDGTYQVRLMLRDKQGHTYREAKTFVIASKPPAVKVKIERKQFHHGEAVRLNVSASDTTRTIVARLYGAAPAYLRWNARRDRTLANCLCLRRCRRGNIRCE